MTERRNRVISVWTTEKGAKALEQYQKDDMELEAVLKILNNGKGEMEACLESVEEDALRFKGMLLSYKKAYQEVLKEQSDSWLNMWEEMGKGLPSFKSDINKFKEDFTIVSEDLSNIKKLMQQIVGEFKAVNTYELRNMVELITKINDAPQSTKDILKAVLK